MSTTPTGDSAPAIQTVQRAAEILNAFTVAQPRLSLNQITAAIGTSKATAHRYTKALRESGLLRYDKVSALYTLGSEVLALEAAARAGLPVAGTAEPHMARLVRETGHTVVLSVWDGETPTVVRCIDNTSGAVRLRVTPGTRLDLFDSAQGRVFCTYLPSALVPALERRLQVSPSLAESLDAIAASGISANAPSVHGIRTLAAPVFEDSRIIATVGVIGTDEMFQNGLDQGADLAQGILRLAKDISTELGTPPDAWPRTRRN